MEGIVHEMLVGPMVRQTVHIRSTHIIDHNFFIVRATYLRFGRHIATIVGDTS